MSDKKKDTKKDQKTHEYYAFLKAFGDANPSMPLKVQHEKVPEIWTLKPIWLHHLNGWTMR